MNARVSGPQLLIIVSMVFVGVGLFTPLPYVIFSTIGVVGVLVGWLMDISYNKKSKQEDYIDLDINVTEDHSVTFDERLRKLEELKNDALISEDEYQLKREEIMKDQW